MSVTYDFQIVDTNLCGVSQIIPQNEEALRYLVEEAHFSTFADGSAALFEENAETLSLMLVMLTCAVSMSEA